MDRVASRKVAAAAAGVCLLLFALGSRPLGAHAPIEQRISALSEQLARDPDNIESYLRRGELHASHQEWAAAEADFEQVLALDPKNLEVRLQLGKMYQSSNRPQLSEAELKRYLAWKPEHSLARISLAKTLSLLGRHMEAAAEYSRGIDAHARPSPDWYLQRARILAEAGDDFLHEAITGLDQGMQRLGQLSVLQQYAISLEIRGQRYDAALVRLDRIAMHSSRQETWLLQRAEILARAGRDHQALETTLKALAALDSLPPYRRNNPAMRQLESAVLALQKRLTSNPR